MEKKQQVSLLSFFSKSPKPPTPKNKSETKDNANNNNNSGKGAINNNSGKSANNNNTPNGKTANTSKLNGSSPELKEKSSKNGASAASASASAFGGPGPGDIVWARLEGYPPWPGMVCVDPVTSSSSSPQFSRLGKIHVQFFDETSSHAWVKKDAVSEFENVKQVEWGGEFFCRDKAAKKGAEQAQKALAMDRKERLKKLSADLHDESIEEGVKEGEEEDGGKEEEEKENKDKSKKRRREERDESPPAKRRNADEDDDEDEDEEKSGGGGMKGEKRRRIVLPMDSSDDEDDFKEGKKEPKNEKKKSRKSDDDFRPPPEIEESDEAEEEENFSDASSSSAEGLDEIKAKYGQKKKAAGGKKKTSKQIGTPAAASKSKTTLPSTPKTPTANRNLTLASSSSSSSSSPKPPSTPSSILSKLSHFAAPSEIDESSSASGLPNSSFKHESYEFLKPEKIRDGNRRRPDDPDYDPRTLFVPNDFLNQQTPAQRQWWEFKAKHFDVILFFKQGKFYELYHTDCVLAVKECGLAFMKGDHAHCGFPEKAGPRYAEALIQKGFSVARIEQTETPDMMQERVKGMSRPTKFDKVVKREICAITTKATRRFGYMDKEASDSSASYLLALCEKELTSGVDGKANLHYGIAFVDAAVGKFVVGEFEDDRLCSRLRTLLAHWPPEQILVGKGDKMITPKTLRLLKASCPSAILSTPLVSGSEFWEAEKTLRTLAEGDYFRDEKTKEMEWPAELKTALVSDTDSLGLTPKPGQELAVRSLGALIWYLTKCVIDHELLSMKLFEIYRPMDVFEDGVEEEEGKEDAEAQKRKEDQNYIDGCRFMVLDGLTMSNLDVLSVDGSLEGSLLARIDRASTPFGKRLLREWLAAPLCDLSAIRDRQDAVDDLIENRSLLEEAGSALKKLPDLERLLSRIHAMGSSTRHSKHPDGRAIIFEADIFDKRKIEDFIKILEGYEKAVGVVETFQKESSIKCRKLKNLTSLTSSGGSFPDLEDQLTKFAGMFDRDKARKEGIIEPKQGVDEEFDEAAEGVDAAKKKLNDYRKKLEKQLECGITFFHQGKTTYQLEMPDKKKVSSQYKLVSSKKGFKRYHTDEVIELRDSLNEAEQLRDELVKATSRKVFRKFDENASLWTKACRNLATLDALCSLAKYSVEGSAEMTRPEFLSAKEAPEGKPFVEIRNGVHPTVVSTFSGDDYIPNDIVIGIKDVEAEEEEQSFESSASTVLVTGPNMGGKSTLMRQAASLIILSQLGCRVPASKCRLTPVDRIFTRLGAKDNIVGGESTFFVEMSETAAILRHATGHSLVLVDELGRGTSTYDGTAVASAVLKQIIDKKKCRCLFSTHYHLLVDAYQQIPGVRLGHMACMVENAEGGEKDEDEEEEDPTKENITFLYKFISGNCPRSYGFNTAKLAGVPDDVVRKAYKKAKEMERGVLRRKKFQELLAGQLDVMSA